MPKIIKNKISSAYNAEKVLFRSRFMLFYFHNSWKSRIFAAVQMEKISYSKNKKLTNYGN
jgi:hypothetical protein